MKQASPENDQRDGVEMVANVDVSAWSDRKHASRVLCVWLPDFPIQRLRCGRTDGRPVPSPLAEGEGGHGEVGYSSTVRLPLTRPSGTLSPSSRRGNKTVGSTALDAIVLYSESGNHAQVVTASEKARHCSVRPGMPLAEAQALIESATFLPHDVEADVQELGALADVCYHYSPFVGIDLSNDAHCLLLDISGCGPLFGDESALARQLVIELAERGYFVHTAVAGTIGAAWAIARYGHGTGSDRRLRSLPIEALRIPNKLIKQLHEFDLRTIGQLTALPRESLPSRFGTELSERLNQMFGLAEESIEPVPRPEPVSAEWTTDEPISHPAAIQYVCTDLLTEILDTLSPRRKGLQQLTITLHSDASRPEQAERSSGSAALNPPQLRSACSGLLTIGLSKPTDSAPHILKLLELKLESTTIPEWIHTIHMEASVVASLPIRQHGLFAEQNSASDNEHVRKLADRLTARLGRNAVTRPRLLPEAIPEQATTDASLTEPHFPVQRPFGLDIASVRPLILLSPLEPIQATTAEPDGPPLSFRWNHRTYRIARSTEIERIATGWWQKTGSTHRDYYQAEIQSGTRYWLFRDRNNEWFLHGMFE